ncbi:MAG: hypothetical protein FJ279_29745, partial [Planctomycetes bacterium]|nr:hypothetical protein [Planctomycetota bacterium]
AAQHDLLAVLRLVDAGKLRANEESHRATGASLQAIAQVLQGGDFYPPEKDEERGDPGPIKAFAWPLLLRNAGLVNLSGSKLQLTPAGRKALTAPPHETIRPIWKQWLDTTALDEFSRVNAVKGQGGKGKRQMTAVAERRSVIVETLAECPSDEWISVDELSRFMRATGRGFQVTHNPWSLYISDPQYGSLGYDGYHDWNILQGRYILAFLFEYAATLGLIDVAFMHPAGARRDYHELWGTDDLPFLSRYDGLTHFRINALGAWCLGQAEHYVPAPPEARQALKVLPTLEIVAVEQLQPSDALFLDLFAEKTSDTAWKIQPARLLQAVDAGHSVSEVEAFLSAQSGGSLPDTVAAFFKDMAERASCLTDRGPALLIEAADPSLAQRLVNDARLRTFCLLAGESHIVVPAQHESAFRRALRELGHALPPAQPDKR